MHELKKLTFSIVRDYFRDAFRPAVLSLTDRESLLGEWRRDAREISLSRAFVLSSPWGSVVEVLKHEIAHQYVDEVLKVHDETAHGAAFRRTCEMFGVDARARGIPESNEVSPLMDKIVRLLALTESPNRHEAEAAALAAKRLIQKYQIESVETGATFRFRHLGEVKGRVFEHERVLASILAAHFGVEVIWVSSYLPLLGKRGSILEVVGTHETTSVAEYVHAFLLRAANDAWTTHYETTDVPMRDRLPFLAGVMCGVRDRLTREKDAPASSALVHLAKEKTNEFLRKRYPYIRSVRHVGNARKESFGEGREVGRKITIRKGVESGAGPVRLLTGRSS